ncbi:flagellar export chaperone FliS [Thalassotalea atypica]|uniref:flagellar export chaperone FliS n=1 Tax=Thalassotalea atypica TaxID=2054316 RepID=UPI0025741D18|nr:flagellar export chaperone FliS [Thalassotalea atypica]
MRKNIKAYNKVNIESGLVNANPHQVILMMYSGIIDCIANTKGAIERKDIQLKTNQITKAISLLEALQSALDSDAEPEISDNFFELYAYCIDKFIDVNVDMNIDTLSHIDDLLRPLRDAWAQMPEDGKQQGIDLLKQKDQQASAVGI